MHEKYATEFPKLSAPAFRALDAAGVTQLRDLTRFTEQELLSLHGFGPKALRQLREALSARGMNFAIR